MKSMYQQRCHYLECDKNSHIIKIYNTIINRSCSLLCTFFFLSNDTGIQHFSYGVLLIGSFMEMNARRIFKQLAH